MPSFLAIPRPCYVAPVLRQAIPGATTCPDACPPACPRLPPWLPTESFCKPVPYTHSQHPRPSLSPAGRSCQFGRTVRSGCSVGAVFGSPTKKKFQLLPTVRLAATPAINTPTVLRLPCITLRFVFLLPKIAVLVTSVMRVRGDTALDQSRVTCCNQKIAVLLDVGTESSRSSLASLSSKQHALLQYFP